MQAPLIIFEGEIEHVALFGLEVPQRERAARDALAHMQHQRALALFGLGGKQCHAFRKEVLHRPFDCRQLPIHKRLHALHVRLP